MTRYISTDAQHQFAQNLAAISGDFHTHALYFAFYDAFGKLIDGFVGNYEVCIQMAAALTDWEIANGAAMAYENLGTPWIVMVERYVDALIHLSIETGEIPNSVYTLDRVITASRCLP
jgi:membrane-associated PAP2 superfamily phosphatase